MTNMPDNNNSSMNEDILLKAEAAMKSMEIPEGPSAVIAEQTLAAVLEEASDRSASATHSSKQKQNWTGLAGLSSLVAATVLIVAGFGLLGPQSTLAFEDLTKPFKNNKTLTYKTVMVPADGSPGLKIDSKLYFKEPGLSRTESTGGAVVVRDETQGITLFSFSNTKAATVMKSDQNQGTDATSSQMMAPVNWLKSANASGEKIESRTINGIEAPGFATQFGAVQIKIWGDPKTKIPLLIEMPVQAAGTEYTLSMSDFEFDKELSDSLFSVEPPVGYTVSNEQTPEIDYDLVENLTPEEHVQRFLKYYSDLHDGQFPEQIDNPGLITEITQKLYEDGDFTEEEKKAMYNMTPSMGAIWTYRQSLSEFGYQSGVQLGEEDRLVFWYRPAESDSFKVIYGDLRIGEITAEELKTHQE